MNSQRQLQIQQFVQSLSDEELHALYHQLGDRMHLARRARELYALKDFHVLDRVSFEHAGRRVEGTVIRINQRTISVMSTGGIRWKVSPQLLRKLESNANADSDYSGYGEDSSGNDYGEEVSEEGVDADILPFVRLANQVSGSGRPRLPGQVRSGNNPGKKKNKRKKRKR